MTTGPARQPEAEPPQRTESPGPGAARAAIAGMGGGAASRVLALQRAVGNRAVAALLARDPTPNAPPPQPAPPAPKTTSAIVAGIGTIPLVSFSFRVAQSGSG